jgi:uncharacterized beta-barrel protein YwiB (DUF1934 family)
MSSHSVILHIQIIDHLDRDTTQSYDLSAINHTQPRSLTYIENDNTTHVELLISPDELVLKRNGAWQTQLIFRPNAVGSFRIVSDQGEMQGSVKTLNSVIEPHKIELTYQLIMDHSIITHQTLTVTIRGALA